MQMGYKVLFVMLLNAKATLVYTGHVSKQDPFDFVWSNHYKEPLRCQHILLKYSDVLQQLAYHVNDCAAWKGTFTPTLSVHILLVI